MKRIIPDLLSVRGKLGVLRASLCALVLGVVSSLSVHAQGGFAGTVTGGAGGPTVTVTTLDQLNAAINDDVARIVNVSGTINLGTANARFGSNKTIQGVGTNSGFIGNLKGVGESNVIIQRLNFTNPNSVGDADGLGLEGCTRIWVDHCSFVDCGDGSLDIKRAADLITVSWCKFSYTFNSGHNFVNLVGHSDSNATQDRGKLRITFHHNWWSTGCVERMPRVRFGQVHSYNNYFNAPGNNYCIRASIESQVLAESNYFENIDTPYEYFSPNGRIRAVNNVTVNCTNVLTFNDSVFTPPYSYSPESASNVKASVMAGAGSGGGGGGGTTLNVSPTSLSFGAAAGSQTVTISSNTSWSVTDNQAWITVSPTSGSNNGSTSVSVTQNTGAARSGTVTISGGGITRTVSVSQAAAGGGGTTITLQAESGTVGGGTTIDNNNAGFNGTGFANFPLTGGSLQHNSVSGGSASGSRTIAVRYALGATSSRTGRVLVNGVAQNITFQPTGAWTTWSTVNFSATLNSGTTNTIRFESTGQDMGNIDQISFAVP